MSSAERATNTPEIANRLQNQRELEALLRTHTPRNPPNVAETKRLWKLLEDQYQIINRLCNRNTHVGVLSESMFESFRTRHQEICKSMTVHVLASIHNEYGDTPEKQPQYKIGCFKTLSEDEKERIFKDYVDPWTNKVIKYPVCLIQRAADGSIHSLEYCDLTSLLRMVASALDLPAEEITDVKAFIKQIVDRALEVGGGFGEGLRHSLTRQLIQPYDIQFVSEEYLTNLDQLIRAQQRTPDSERRRIQRSRFFEAIRRDEDEEKGKAPSSTNRPYGC